LKYLLTILFFSCTVLLNAQQANNLIQKGNEAYRKGDYAAAAEQYKSALRKDPQNNTARFNLANTLQRQNQSVEATKNYDDIIAQSDESSLKAASNYNKGLAYLQQKDLQKAIAAFETSLKQDATDEDARENLQKALNELKKQQGGAQDKQQKQKKNPEQKKKQPPLNKEMMQQKFNELRNQEKQLQQKLQSKNNTSQPEKDW